jgi:hypothetical protein
MQARKAQTKKKLLIQTINRQVKATSKQRANKAVVKGIDNQKGMIVKEQGKSKPSSSKRKS